MHRRTDVKTFRRSSELRHQLTASENRLWQLLRNGQFDGIHFRRQHAIGTYIVDFCAPNKKLIIEVDGGQHIQQQAYDAERTAYLESKGYRVLRFWNNEVMNNREEVIRAIFQAIESEGE